MFRIAEKVALKERCDFIVTGENLGQVASQTLTNMVSEASAVKMMILRPLLCNDKNETVNIAKNISTFETSVKSKRLCRWLPDSPATRSRLEMIENEEKKLNIDALVRDSLKSAKIIKIYR